MKIVDKVISKLEDYIRNNVYENIESDAFELKSQPANKKDTAFNSIKQTICAFLNTDGGIVLIGVKEDVHARKYIFTGYNSDFEEIFKSLHKDLVNDANNLNVDVEDYITLKLHDFLGGKVLAIYVDSLPHDKKYVFYNKIAYTRKLTGDHPIGKLKIEAQEEYKQEIQYAKELRPVVNSGLENLSVDKLNDYIYWINREIKIESTKADIEQAKSFLIRKSFITKDDHQPTILGMLVCGQNPDDFLGTRCQVDCYVNAPLQIAQSKKVIKDNILSLLESGFSFVFRNIQVGIKAENSGSELPEYPENLIRECINNSLAHRDYTIDRFISIDIVPQKHIEIRNPGGFKKTLILEDANHEIPLRRIVPNQKPVNPKLADVLKVFNKYEGKGIGMATLVNECLNDRIDIPFYKFRDENDISLIIQKGKLLDKNLENRLDIYSGFIKELTDGEELSSGQKHILAYLYKSERENEKYHYTILLTPDNNHFDAIRSLEKCGLIYKHELSTSIHPVFVVHRELMKENFNAELRKIFGIYYTELAGEYKECLKLIYQINTYSQTKSVSASQIANMLYSQQFGDTGSIQSIDNFKRKVRSMFNKLESSGFIVKNDKRFTINRDFMHGRI